MKLKILEKSILNLIEIKLIKKSSLLKNNKQVYNCICSSWKEEPKTAVFKYGFLVYIITIHKS